MKVKAKKMTKWVQYIREFSFGLSAIILLHLIYHWKDSFDSFLDTIITFGFLIFSILILLPWSKIKTKSLWLILYILLCIGCITFITVVIFILFECIVSSIKYDNVIGIGEIICYIGFFCIIIIAILQPLAILYINNKNPNKTLQQTATNE